MSRSVPIHPDRQTDDRSAFLLGSVILIGISCRVWQTDKIRSLSVLLSGRHRLSRGRIAMGLGKFLAAIDAAPWVRLPTFLPYGFAWPNTAGLTTILIDHLVAATYTMSITLALSAMVGIEQSDRRVRGAVAADGLGSIIAALFGGVSLISYDPECWGHFADGRRQPLCCGRRRSNSDRTGVLSKTWSGGRCGSSLCSGGHVIVYVRHDMCGWHQDSLDHGASATRRSADRNIGRPQHDS